MEDGNGIWLTLGLDKEGFKRKLEEAKNDVLKFSSIASASGSTLERLLKTPTRQLGSMGSEIKAVGDNIEKAWGIVRTLEGQVRDETKKLKEAYDEVRKAAGAAFMSGDDEQYRRLQSYQNALKGIIGSYKGVGEEVSNCAKELEKQDEAYKNVTDRMPMLNSQLRNVRGEMQAMVQAAREQGGETAVAAVKSSEAYQQLQQKAKQLGITINEVNKETRMLATNTAGLQGVVSGLQGIVGGFSAAQGAMAVFGAKSEDLQKIQTRVQGCIAAMMGLQQVMQTLQKNSAFMIALSKLRTAFVGLAGGATTATGAVKALWTALKANPAGLVLTAITALVTALGVFAAKARKTAEDVAQEMKEMAERIHNELSEIKVRANLVWDNEESKRNLEELSQEWAREFELQQYELEKQVRENESKLYSFYRQEYSEKKAEEKAKAAYLEGYAGVKRGLTEQYEEFLKAGDKVNAARVEYQIAYLSGDKEFINEALVQWRQYWIDSLQLQKDAVSETHTMQDSARKAEIDAMKDGLEKRLAEIEYERKQELAALDNYVNDLKKKYGGINAEQQGLIDSKRANINTKYDNKRDKAEDDDREERARRAKTIRETAARLQREYDQAMEAYRKSVAKTNQQVQNDIRQITIDGMEDGLEKTLEQLRLNHDKEMAQIEEQENEKIEQWRQLKEKEWAAQNPKADAGKNPYRKKAMYDENGVFQRGSLSETDAADLANALAVFTTMRENENEKWKRNESDAMRDVLGEQQDYISKRLALERQYQSDRAVLVAKGATDEQLALFESKHLAEQKALFDELLGDYASYEGKREDVTKKYAKLRRDIEQHYKKEIDDLYEKDENGNFKTNASGSRIFKQGKSQDDVNAIAAQQQGSMQQINASENEEINTLIQGYGDMVYNTISGQTVEALKKLQKQAQQALEAAKKAPNAKTKAGQEAIKKAQAELDGYTDALVEAAAKSTEPWKKVAEAVNKVGAAFSNLGDAIGGTTGEVVSFVGQTITSVGTTISTVTEGIKKVSEATTAAMKSVETASVVLTVISIAVQLIQKLNNLIKSSNEKKKAEEAAKATKEYQDKVGALTKAYEKLSDAIDKAYGREKSRLIQEQIKELEKLIKVEQDALSPKKDRYTQLLAKKNKWDSYSSGKKAWLWLSNGYKYSREQFTDKDREELEKLEQELKESSENIEEYQKRIAELRQQAVDAIFGEDIQSAIERFGDALMDAWEKGKDASKSAKDFVNDMIKSMFKQALLSAIEQSDMMKRLRGMLQAWFNTIDLGLNATPANLTRDALQRVDGAIRTGVIERFTPTLEDIQNYGAQMADALSGIGEIYRQFLSDTENDRSASARGNATASQESVDELNGRATTIQGHTFTISENSNIIRDNTNAILGSVRQIEVYTQHLVRMDNDIHSLKNTISDIQTQGVRLRNS